MTLYRKQLIFLDHNSAVLKDNPLGDPHQRELPVYLPPDYHQTEQHYPVVWVLAPFTGWGEKLFNLSAWDESIVERADRLMRGGTAAPAILAFPNAFTTYGGSQYLNSSAVGRYEDYLTEELIPFLDAQLRTLPAAEHRAILGHSSGGYGALVLAMRHPDLFRAVASHAGDMFFEACYWPDIPGAIRTLERYPDLADFLHEVKTLTHTRDTNRDWFNALSLCAMSACYSPNPQTRTGFDLPFDPYTGEIDKAVWSRWQFLDPVRMAADRLDVLRVLKTLYFDCGVRDEYNLFLGARRLHRLLKAADISHHYAEFDGSHRNLNWRYEVSLPIITNAIAA